MIVTKGYGDDQMIVTLGYGGVVIITPMCRMVVVAPEQRMVMPLR